MTSARESGEENIGEILVVWQKYKANGPDELDLGEGDMVELLDTEDPTKSPSKRIKLDPELDNLANKGSLLDSAAARHKLSVKPLRRHASSRYSPTRNTLDTRWLVKQIGGSRKQGWVPCNILQSTDEPKPGSGLPGDAAFRRQAVVKELVETEHEFVKDLDYVVQEYLIRTESTKVPKVIKDNLELVFGGLVEIANFHRTVLMEGVKYYANEPNLLGKAFLRLERDFDKHVKYCTDEPIAQAFLESCDAARDYFDDLSQRLGDDKNLSEHLKLPIQRINDYQLLLKELVRYSECLGENCSNLQNALELMLSVPHRAEDDKFTSSIEGYRGSIYKLGRLISHDWFSVTFGNLTKERYLFLFKARILITKVRRISEDRSIFQLKDIIRLPQIEIKDRPDDKTFELVDKVGGHSLILASRRDHVKELWLKEIREFASDVEDQTEEIQIVSEATSTLVTEEVLTETKSNVVPQATEAQHLLAAALKSGIQEKLESVTSSKVRQELHEETVPAKKQKLTKDQNYNNVPAPNTVNQEVSSQVCESVKKDQKEKIVNSEQKETPDKTKAPKEESTLSDRSIDHQLSESTEKTFAECETSKSITVEETFVSAKTSQKSELKTAQNLSQKNLTKNQAVESISQLSKSSEKVSVKTKEESKTVSSQKLQTENTQSSNQKTSGDVQVLEAVAQLSKSTEQAFKETAKNTKENTKVVATKSAQKVQLESIQSENQKTLSEIQVVESIIALNEDASIKSQKKSTEGHISEESSISNIVADESSQSSQTLKNSTETEVDVPKAKKSINKKLQFVEATKEVESSSSETLKSCESPNSENASLQQQPALSQHFICNSEGFGERNPDEPPIPIPVPPPPVVKPHHNKIEVSVVETQIGAVNLGVQVSVEVDDKMSRRYSGKGGEDYDSSFSRRSIKRSSYAASDGVSSSRHESSLSGKYGTESISTKYGSETLGSSKYGSESLSGSKYSVESSNKYGTESLTSKYGDYSGKYAEGAETGSLSYTRKSLLGDTEGSKISTRRATEAGIEDGSSYSRKYHSESLDSGDLLSSYSRKYGSDLGGEGESFSYSRKSVSALESGNLGDGSKYSSRKTTATSESLDGGGSKYARKNYSSYKSIDDSEDEVLSKYSRKGSSKEIGYERQDSTKRAISINEDEDTLSKFSKYERRISETKKVVCEDDEEEARIEAEMRKKYAPSVSVESKIEESQVEAKSFSRSESKDYKRSDSIEVKTSERKTKTQISTEEEGLIKTQNSKSHETSESTKINSNEERRGSETKVGADGAVSTTFKIRRESSVIEGKPNFKRRLSGTNVEPGESAVFEVELSTPTDSVTWLKDNRPLRHLKRIKTTKTEDGVCRLEIKEAEAHDVGLYSAVATNSIGNSTCSAQLIVHELTEQERAERLVTDKPVFLVQLKDTELLEDTYLRFMVKVKGDPTPKISFFKDDVQIKEHDEKYQIVREASGKGFYELVIPQVQHSDSGKYKCVASNKFGEASSEATVTVTDFKNIFGDLSEDDPLLPPGEKPNFYWKKDGNIFEPEERFKVLLADDDDSLALVFQHVRPEDAGLYTCVAQTSSGHISCSAELTVHGVLNQLLREPEKPQLIVENKEASASVGNSAMLELQVKGYPKPQIKWTHDGKPIEPGGKYKFLYEDDEESMSLVIKNVQPVDAGTYHASAENELGSDSAEMTLIVKAPPKIKTKFEDISVSAGTTIRVPVEVEGMPKPTLQFYKDGQEIKKSERIKIVEEGEKHILVIEKSNVKDAGSYSVVATNEISQSSNFWNIDVFSPPKITKSLGSNKIVSLKEEVVLSVTVEAKPEAEVTWYKNEVEIKSDKHCILKKDEDSYILKISGTVSTDSASYKVRAKNIHGSVDDDCRVDVKIPPKLTKSLSDMTVVEHQKNVELDVKVDAFPKPAFKWYFDEMEISESRTEFTRIESDDGSKLVIKEVSSDLSGRYKCKVVNELGETETSAKLTVNCKPRFIKQLKDTTIDEGATLHLEVEVEACPEPSVKWLRNGREVTTDARIKITRDSQRYEAYHLAVDLIKYEEQGEYEVVVTNSLGTVSSRSTVTVQKVTHTDAIEETEPPKKQKFNIEVVDNEDEVVIEELKLKEPDVAQENESDEGFSDEKHDNARSEPIVEEPYSPDEYFVSKKVLQDSEIGIITTEEDMPKPEHVPRKSSLKDKLLTFDTTKIEEIQEEAETVEALKHAERKDVESVAVGHSGINGFLEEDVFTGFKKSEKISVSISDNVKQAKIKEVPKPKLRRGSSSELNEAKVIIHKIETQFSVEEELDQPQTPEIKLFLQEEPLTEVLIKQSLTNACITEDSKPKKPKQDFLVETSQTNLEDDQPSKLNVSEVKSNGSLHGDEFLIDDVETESLPYTKDKNEEVLEALPKILESTLKDKSQYESLEVCYMVKATANPKPSAVWTRDDKPIKADSHLTLSENGDEFKLEIKKLDKKDAGVYECKISNPVGDVKSQKAKLTVIPEAELRKPKVKDGLVDKTILKSNAAKLSALITGEPVPDATWLVDGKEITPDQYEKYKIVLDTDDHDIENDIKECTFSLSIPKSDQENTGKYKIKAKNKWGECDSSAQLTIVFRPEIVEGPNTINVMPGESAEFSATVIAHPAAKVTWCKDGVPLESKKNIKIEEHTKNNLYKVIFDNVELSDEGKYQIVAKNDIGETTADTKLKTIKEVGPTPEKPYFITVLSDAEIEDQEEIILMVRADGIPKPEVAWYFKGKPLEEDEAHKVVTKSEAQITSTLSLPKFGQNDIGQYKAVATNLVGETETVAKISMTQKAPTFGKMLDRAQDINEGEPLKLVAKISGSPKPTVCWLKNGEPLVGDHIQTTILPDGTVKLYIDKVKPSDSGAYKLVIKNPNGETSSLCAVAVTPKPQRPKFLKCIKDVQVTEGQPIRLEAQVAGYPPPEIKWLKDGVPIRPSSSVHLEHHPDGSVALIVDCVKPENAGTYTLLATNKLGESENEAKVSIDKRPTKPEFITVLQPMSVVEGFPAKMEVKAKAFPPPKITWTRNGTEIIPDNQHIKITDLPDGSSVLLIDACDILRDPMPYKAIASNEAGETESAAILSVTPATKPGVPEEAPMFLTSMRDAIADEGQPLVIEIPFTANPIPKVEWFKDDQPIEPSDKVLLTCDGKKVGLKIDECAPADAGKYSVKLTNALGSDISDGKAVIHKVFSPPRFTQRFTDTQQLLDHDAKLSGKVSGVPTPEITWYKDGTEIKPSDKYKMKTDGDVCTLYVNNCQPSDVGLYRAFAVNREGSDTCEAQLSVVDEIITPIKAEAPSFLKRIGDMDLYKGMTAKFTACASGFPEPTVEWFRNDKKLKPSDRIKMEVDQAGLLRLTISKISEDDLGTYSCKITNEHGSDSCSAKLQFDDIDAKPRKPISDEYTEFDKHQKSGIPVPLSDPPIISRMTERHCTLSWKPSVPSYARAPVTYLLEMCELPHGDWFTARSGIRNCDCTVRNLEPFRDYRFRIRIENKYGISDPSPYANTFRQKLEPDPPKFNTYLPLGIPFHPDSSPYFPRDFDIERPPHDNMAQSPRFLRQEHPTQYGMKDQNTNLFWYVYGYPKPKMEYYFNDEPIESGGRFDMSYTRNGQATLFINKMLERDVGWYEAVATNEHGIARQRVRLEIAELPEFIRRPDIQYSMIRGKARFEARIVGQPYPDIKWYRDWKPVVESSRVKIKFIEPDLCIFTIDDVILKDYGLYSVSARNVAGSISSSAMLYVDESDSEYKLHTYSPISIIKSKKKLFEDFFDIGDELGRGTQGITYHAVDRSNGYNYAAKIMQGRGELRPFMYNELDMLNQLRHRRLIALHEAYESEDRLVLLLELGGGGELVKDYLLKRDYYTESEIAGYIRQILQGYQYMHDRGYGHMGLNIGDILLTHPGSHEIKITDFSLTRRITPGNLYPLWYGVPEYACPEAVRGEGTGYGQDMWSIGIITYILLSGRSPFLGKDDRETLNSIIDGHWSFDMDWWCNISVEARDFISKLLVYDSSGRLDINAALRHPWLERSDRTYRDEYQISTKYLHNYYLLYREWYDNASCRKWFRRRRLETAFTHPSRMVYPPGESYTPPPSPMPQRKHFGPLPKTWEDQLPSRSPLNYEIGLFKSESHYQNGPDTYLLQLRDVSFPVRVREYMKVAANRGPGRSLVMSNENGFDWETPVVRERRRFTDVMDEEIDDERKARINQYGVDNVSSYSIRRLRRELGPRLDTYAEAEAMIESKQDGRLPFFREKPQVTAMVEGKEVDLTCFVVGDPKPTIQWFKNDGIVVESARVGITTDADGRTHFKLSPALGFDLGMYRVVARNKVGQTVAWTRIVYGQVPDSPDSPDANQVSDTEILLTWKAPKHDGNSPVLCYSLQYKLIDGTEWIKKADNIDHEFYLMSNLESNKKYLFRLAACNAIGWSEQGVPSAAIHTLKPSEASKIELSTAMRHLQQITDSGKPVEPEVKLRPDYTLESKPVEWSSDDATTLYDYISEIHKGHFSTVVKAIDKKTDRLVVAKTLDLTSETTESVDGEFAALRSLRHERIAGLLEAYRTSSVATFIMEKLQGSDVLTYLASRHEYTEETVATIVTQVLNGLQYLHWRNLCHLDIQPDNIVMCGLRSVQVKLVDFGCAHRVTKLGTKVPVVGHPDYISPEVLNQELAYPQTDIWSLGVLTYVMLSGVLPFQGQDTNETRQNISFVRYRFEYLYQELSQEGNRFVMMIFKRHPNKRPSAEECHENRWLLPTDSMIKKRERAVFLGSRLKEYCEKYHQDTIKPDGFRTVKSNLTKSLSIQEELLISP